MPLRTYFRTYFNPKLCSVSLHPNAKIDLGFDVLCEDETFIEVLDAELTHVSSAPHQYHQGCTKWVLEFVAPSSAFKKPSKWKLIKILLSLIFLGEYPGK